jgi:hypothetical protein
MHLRLALVFVAMSALSACSDDTRQGTALTDVEFVVPDTAVAADTAIDTSPDIADVVDFRPCEPLSQTGCRAGENCTHITDDDIPHCVPSGPVPPGGECNNDTRCSVGVCLSINQTKSLCYQFCAADADCGGVGGTCLTLTNTPFKVCKIDGIYDTCGLLAQDCADPAKACYAVANEPEPICLREGAGELGSGCSGPTSCKRGLACVNDVCRALCDPDVAGSCGAGADCRNFFDDAGFCFVF